MRFLKSKKYVDAVAECQPVVIIAKGKSKELSCSLMPFLLFWHAETRNSNVMCDAKRDGSSRARSRAAISFTFRQLAIATRNFREANFIGAGGFGKVFKGQLENGQIVAVKQLNHEGCQGHEEFVIEILMLSLLHHQNLVTLVGYCADGDQRLLVYEYMPMGSLENHLFDLGPHAELLSWNARIKIALDAARGLEYLHCKANPPVIYRDLKSANILLDTNLNAKLSDFGLAKLGPVGDNTHVSTRVMGTYGYCAPEYAMSGHLTLKSDIYSYGVVLLELITGRKAYDRHKRTDQVLAAWALPHLKDPKMFIRYADPFLQGRFPVRSIHNMISIAAMCIQEKVCKGRVYELWRIRIFTIFRNEKASSLVLQEKIWRSLRLKIFSIKLKKRWKNFDIFQLQLHQSLPTAAG